MPPAIKVENLSKSYLVGHNATRTEGYTALRDVLARNVRNLGRKTRDMLRGRQIVQGDEVEEFWALKDVSFEVQPGERVGIIGRNGAGKSTLLKILSRITEPTQGRVTLNGRVASLLEVGTGFHPELTGRENIFLNGAILGMSRKEIQRKFDEIVDFAEVEKFLDTPVKRYSSGMYVRLAFAVAAHLEPDILVVDEVLAVGDASFQRKCFIKMEDVSNEGRTILFVSHNLAAIEQLTVKCVLLDSGLLRLTADTSKVIRQYTMTESQTTVAKYSGKALRRKGWYTGDITIKSLWFVKDSASFQFNENISIFAEVQSSIKSSDVSFSLTIYTAAGKAVGSAFTKSAMIVSMNEAARFLIQIENQRLACGNYYMGFAVGIGTNADGHINTDVVHEVLFFRVLNEVCDDGMSVFWSSGWGDIVLEPLIANKWVE